jgi:hypothetical protein
MAKKKERSADQVSRATLASDLADLEAALHAFLTAEIAEGLITPFKMAILNQVHSLLALAEKARRDVFEAPKV